MLTRSALKKITFALPQPLLEKLRALAGEKKISSVNAAVREALEEYVARLEQEEFRQAIKAAANDPEFLRDIKDTTESFRHTDGETAEMIPEW